MTAEEEKELLDQKQADGREALTIRFQMKTYHYKTQRDLFLNISACGITKKSNGIICFSPSRAVTDQAGSSEPGEPRGSTMGPIQFARLPL